MRNKNISNDLKKKVRSKIQKIENSKKEHATVLAQTIYLGTLGFIFILPVIIGAYAGLWLDEKLKGFSISWTISLIIVGLFVGIINVYLFIKERL